MRQAVHDINWMDKHGYVCIEALGAFGMAASAISAFTTQIHVGYMLIFVVSSIFFIGGMLWSKEK